MNGASNSIEATPISPHREALHTPPLMERESQVGTLPTPSVQRETTLPTLLPTPPLMERSRNRRPTCCRRLSTSWWSTLPAGSICDLPLQSALERASDCPALTAGECSGGYSNWNEEEDSDVDDGSVWSGGWPSSAMSSNASLGLDPHGRTAFWGLHGLLDRLPPMMERGFE